MNKCLVALMAATFVSGSAFADTTTPSPAAKDLSKAVDKVNYVESDVSGIKLSGYVDAGYIYNFISAAPGLSGNTPNTIGTRFGQDGKSGGDFNLNTVKLTVSKDLTDKNEWQAGFRADVMLGEDAGGGLGGNGSGPNTNNGSDSFLLEQGYVTFRAPVGNGIDFKVGKFVTWLGYEVIERPSNLNITYGNLFQNMIPLYHTGVSAEYKINDNFNTGLAIVNGYNSDSNTGFDSNTDGYGLEAKIGYTNKGGNFSVQNAVYYSWDSAGQVIPSIDANKSSNGNVVINDIVANWTPKFANGKLLLGANGDFGYAQLATNDAGYGSFITGKGSNEETWFGLALYAKYQFTDLFSLAARADYMHDNYGQKLFGSWPATNSDPNGTLDNTDIWSLTLTAGFNLAENLTLRAEYRVDFGDDIQGSYDSSGYYYGNGQNTAQTVAVEAVYTF